MSMQLLTIVQTGWVFFAYTCIVCFLPAFAFGKRFEKETLLTKIVLYFTFGNFWCMNLVFLLQLLHISNRFTLWLFTIATLVGARMYFTNTSPGSLYLQIKEFVRKVLQGVIGPAMLISKASVYTKSQVKDKGTRLGNLIKDHWLELLLGAGGIIAIVYIFGTQLLENFGYKASDINVHNYWINGLVENNLFAGGIYPMGFHALVYYIHEIFGGVRIFEILRVVALTSTLYVFFMLWAFIRRFAKCRYVAIGVVYLFSLCGYVTSNSYYRFAASLPQEFGMVYIFPALLFAFLFLAQRKKEDGAGIRVRSSLYLCGFLMNFAMGLSVHFYGTMATGIFCIAIVIGCFYRVLHKKYIGRILSAGILAIVVAVLPMVIAFALGKPLEGSLRWGMSIINGGGNTENAQESTEVNLEGFYTGQLSPEEIWGVFEEENQMQGSDAQESSPSEGLVEMEVVDLEAQWNAVHEPNLAEKIGDKLVKSYLTIERGTMEDLLPGLSQQQLRVLLLGLLASIALGALVSIFADRSYGMVTTSTSIAAFLMLICLCAARLGLPALMDVIRSGIYASYILAAAVGLAIDQVIYMLTGWIPVSFLRRGLSLATAAIVFPYLILLAPVRDNVDATRFSTNGAITCVTNIVRNNAPYTYTILSANDEYRMTELEGFHEETITFLYRMEGEGANGFFVIPTKMVYVFIEKIPLDYTVSHENSGMPISQQGAAKALPPVNGISAYKGEMRYTVMSRMYQWMETFRKLYPLEVSTYYEDQEFVCYCIHQNIYQPYNLMIDYDYNTRAYTQVSQEQEVANDY